MKRVCRLSLFIAIAVCIPMALHCADPSGAGSETTSGVEIAVTGSTVYGKTTAGAAVMIFNIHHAADISPEFTDSAIADRNGAVVFDNLPSGTYNLFVYPDTALSTGTALFGIPVNGNSPNASYADTALFNNVRTIHGTVTRGDQPVVSADVYIKGSPFAAKVDVTGKFTFTRVPEGVYTIVAQNLGQYDGAADSVFVDLTLTRSDTVDVTINLE